MQENKPTLKFNFTIEKRWGVSIFELFGPQHLSHWALVCISPYCSCKRHWSEAGNGLHGPGCNLPSPPFLNATDKNIKKVTNFIKMKYVCLRWMVLTGSTCWHNQQAKVQLTIIETFLNKLDQNRYFVKCDACFVLLCCTECLKIFLLSMLFKDYHQNKIFL